MILKFRKIELCIITALVAAISSNFAYGINISTWSSDPESINQDNTNINFTDYGCINYQNTSVLPGAISISSNFANDISSLSINTENSLFNEWNSHVSSSNSDGVDSYAIDLLNAKSGFSLNFTGTNFRASSNISDSKENSTKSAVIYLPEAVSSNSNDKTIINFGTINANLESNIQKITFGSPCASTTIGIPILNMTGANNISLHKNQSNNKSAFLSQASAIDNGGVYQFDEVDSSVFGAGKITITGSSNGEEYSQMCNFDLSNFDLSKDDAISTSPRYASVIGAARVSANDGEKNVTINQFNNLHVKNTPKTVVSTAGVDSCDADSYAVVIGGGYVDANLTHGADNNGSCKISQFNDITIDSISGTLEVKTDGDNKNGFSAVVGCARLSATVGDEGGNTISNGHVRQFNNMSIDNISSLEEDVPSLVSSSYGYASVIGTSCDYVTVQQNATDSTIEKFNNLEIDNINCVLQSTTNTYSCIVIGSLTSNYELYGSGSKAQRFNNMTIGNIYAGSSLASSSGNSSAAVIGSAYNRVTIDQKAGGSIVGEFDNLRIGNIYGTLVANGKNYVTTIGLGYNKCVLGKDEEENLKVSDSTIRQFNNVLIGGISENAKLSSTSKNDAAVIGSAYDKLEINGNATNSTIEIFNNLKVGNIAGVLKSEVIGDGDVYGSAIGCSCLDVNGVADIKNVKMFSDVSVQFQKGAIASSVGSSSNGGTVYLNTLGGQYNGYYGEENNDIADGMRFYFNGVGTSNDNDIVIAALEHDNGEPMTYSLTDECRSFAMGPNFQINVGRNRVIDSVTDRETRSSIEDGGIRSKVPGTLRILGNISKSQQNAGCENATMRIDGGWDAQCFGKVSDLQKIDIIEGSLNLMGSSDSAKAELNRAIGRIDDTGVIGDGFKGSLTLADGQILRFGVSGNLDAKTNEKFASKAFRSSDGRVQIRNDGQDDTDMFDLTGGKFSINTKSRRNIPSNSCFYVIRVDNPHDEDTDGNLINVDSTWYEVSDENFNEGGYFGNVKMYKITDSDGKSIVSGKIGILSKNNVHAYKICDQSDQLLGIAIGPEEYGVNDLETITDSVSKSNSGVAVAQDAVASISSITSCVCSCIANGGTNASSQISDESSIAGIISGERQARYIGGRNYALSTQYKNRYSLNPKLFFSPFGEHGHQDKVSDLGYDYNLYGFTAGCSISKYLQSEARISVGIFGSFSGNTTKFCGEKSRLGMRNNQKMYFGGIFGSYEDHDISDLRTNLSIVIGGGRFKNKTWTRITNGGKVRAKFNSSDFHASADFVKNMINIGNSDFHCGPWVALSYNHIHENGHNVVCNGENIANVSSTRFDFLDTTLGINFEKNISYSPEKNISGRIFAKAGWFCRPVRSHSSCTIRADGVDPVNSEFRFSDRNAAIVSGGFKFEFNKKWELSAGVTSRIAKRHWLINGNAVVGYSF